MLLLAVQSDESRGSYLVKELRITDLNANSDTGSISLSTSARHKGAQRTQELEVGHQCYKLLSFRYSMVATPITSQQL